MRVSLTVSKRSGMHKYTYPSSENQFLVLDLEHRDKLLDFKINFRQCNQDDLLINLT